MSTILRSAALAAALALAATAASARSPQYCEGVAQQAVDEATHPIGSAAVGCGAGAIIGSLLTNGKAGGVAGGCAIGAGTGLVISDAKRQQIHDDAYYNCMNGGPGAYNPPPPPGAYNPPPPPPAAYNPPPPPPGPWAAHAITIGNPFANVRVSPYQGSPVAYKLPYGSQIDVKCAYPDQPVGWCKVAHSSNWIKQSALSFN